MRDIVPKYIAKTQFIIRRIYDEQIQRLTEDDFRANGTYGECITLDNPFDTVEEAIIELTKYVNETKNDYYIYTIIPQITFVKEH